MVLVYISIPIMILAVAIATVPLMATMRREERNRRQSATFADVFAEADASRDEEVRAAA
jgi:hypothetical protein